MLTVKQLDKNIVIDDEKSDSNGYVFSIHLKNKYCGCPNCENRTKSIHSIHHRMLQDLPVQNKTVYLDIKMRHMVCRKCGTIFTEPLSFASSKSHMTNRLKDHIVLFAKIFGLQLFKLYRKSTCLHNGLRCCF